MERTLLIEALSSYHDRSNFCCGIEVLDNYIKRQAKQDIKRRVSRVFVATELANPGIIHGYFTLSTLSIELNHLLAEIARKLPRHPIPAALIGRLAVDLQMQGVGIGKMLLVDAIKRTLAVSDEIAIYAIVVDAINDQAEHFYQSFGFSRLNAANRRLFLPLKSVNL